MLEGNSDSPLAAAIELCEHRSSETDRLVKFPGLNKSIGSSGGIDNDPFLMRRGSILAGEDADDLGEFLHEVALCVEAAGGIANEKLNISPVCAVPCIVTKRG